MRLLYLKYILKQPEKSKLQQMLKLQLEKPSCGDWASSCVRDLRNLNIELTFEEIKQIPKTNYLQLLKGKIRNIALEYLLDKRGSKGSEIKYSYLEMADYLLPFNNNLSIEEKCELFAIKNRMINIPNNFSSKSEYRCECGDIETMSHIYECQQYNEEKEPTIPYEKNFTGNLNEEIQVYKRFSENLRKREQQKQQVFPVTSVRCVFSKG